MLQREGTSQSGDGRIILETFESGDFSAIAKYGVGDAGAGRLPVDEQRARAAGPLLTAQVCCREVEPLTQEISEMHARFDHLIDRAAVDCELDGIHFSSA